MTQEPHNLLDSKDQVVGGPVLSDLAVDPGLEVESLRVAHGLAGSHHRTYGSELVKGLCRAVL